METNKKGKEPPKYPEIGARLSQFIADSGQPNARQFALRAGLTPQLVSHLAAGNSIPSGETLMALALAYKDFDSDWLLTGKGRTPSQPPTTTPGEAPGLSVGPTGRLQVAHPTREEWAQLQEENRQLREQLAAKDGKLNAVEEDRNWLRQLVKKDEASADAASLFDTVDQIAREYRYVPQVEMPEIARFVPSPASRMVIGGFGKGAA